jgi:hypothetical protein
MREALVACALTHPVEAASKSTFHAKGPANRMRTRAQCAFRAYQLLGVKHKPALPTDNNAFHAWSRRREASPRIYPNNQVSPACRAAKASLHPQTVRAQRDDETRFYGG